VAHEMARAVRRAPGRQGAAKTSLSIRYLASCVPSRTERQLNEPWSCITFESTAKDL
jgi:hypothetical protein